MPHRQSGISFQVLYCDSSVADGPASRGAGWHTVKDPADEEGRFSVGDVFRRLAPNREVESFLVLTDRGLRLLPAIDAFRRSLGLSDLGKYPVIALSTLACGADWERWWTALHAGDLCVLFVALGAEPRATTEVLYEAIEEAFRANPGSPPLLWKMFRAKRRRALHRSRPSDDRNLLEWENQARRLPSPSSAGQRDLMLSVLGLSQLSHAEARQLPARLSILFGHAFGAVIHSAQREASPPVWVMKRRMLEVMSSRAYLVHLKLTLSSLCLAVAQ